MAVLHENQQWQRTAEFVRTHLRDGEHIFAPPDFSEEFLGITTARASVTPDDVAGLDWVVVHKGRTAFLSSELFDRVKDWCDLSLRR